MRDLWGRSDRWGAASGDRAGVLDRMTDAMTHRGPNDRGTYLADGIALGVRRLSIVDVEGGHQPVSNEDGTVWAVQNGELYNHLDVRARARAGGHRFRSRCDTEVLPHLYERHGVALSWRLRGKFGIAVWDERRRARARARPARREAALLRTRRRPARLRVRAQVPARERPRRPRARLRGDRRLPHLRLRACPARPRLPASRSCCPATGSSSRAAACAPSRTGSSPSPRPTRRPPEPASTPEGLLELARGVGPAAADERRPARGDAERRARLEPHRRLMARNMSEPVKTFSVGFAEDGERTSSPTRAWWRTSSAPTTTSSSSRCRADGRPRASSSGTLDEPLADLSALGLLALSELAPGT